jgi:hypothetical protein
MTVADLAHEAARRYVDTMPIADCARGLLKQLVVPPAGRTPACVGELVSVWRRTLEPALVEHFSIPELHAMARVYSTPEGASVMRKLIMLGECGDAGARGRSCRMGSRAAAPNPRAVVCWCDISEGGSPIVASEASRNPEGLGLQSGALRLSPPR